MARERDPVLYRLQRDAVAACLVMAAGAWLWRPGDPGLALGVLGGGVLAAISYGGIKGGVDAIVRALDRRRTRPRLAWPLVKFFTRYAIVALVAYAVLVGLRAHPVGLLAGASSLVVAAALEAVRSAWAPSRTGNPR